MVRLLPKGIFKRPFPASECRFGQQVFISRQNLGESIMKASFKNKLCILFVFFSIIIIPDANLQAWTEHTLISYPFLASMPELMNAKPVKVENLNDFFTAEGENWNYF